MSDLLIAGQTISCRLLYSDEVHNRVVLTRKQGLVDSKCTIVTSYDQSLVGSIAEGFVVKSMDSGVLVAFYNRVKGFLKAKEFKQHGEGGSPPVGLPIRVKILSVNAEDEKMQLGLPESTTDLKVLSALGIQGGVAIYCIFLSFHS